MCRGPYFRERMDLFDAALFGARAYTRPHFSST